MRNTNGLRERIAAHYQMQLIELYREQQAPSGYQFDIFDNDLPF